VLDSRGTDDGELPRRDTIETRRPETLDQAALADSRPELDARLGDLPDIPEAFVAEAVEAGVEAEIAESLPPCEDWSDCPDDGDQCTSPDCTPEGCLQVSTPDMPCDDGDICTIDDYCHDGQCKGVDVCPECCADGECEDGNPCTWNWCDDGNCDWQLDTGDPSCCMTDAECDDGDPETPDTCLDYRCSHECQKNCCWVSEDCDDGNECTCDHCLFGQCQHSLDPALDPYCLPPPAACCLSHAECEDDSPCTFNYCDAGTCKSKFDPGTAYGLNGYPPALCCQDDLDCKIISLFACPGKESCQGFQCVGPAGPDACQPGSPCTDDGDPCTLDVCLTQAAGCCGNLWPGHPELPPEAQFPAPCCNQGKACDDGNPCTRDVCTKDTGWTCSYTFDSACGVCQSNDPEAVLSVCWEGECLALK
jgi:hypothetical protein